MEEIETRDQITNMMDCAWVTRWTIVGFVTHQWATPHAHNLVDGVTVGCAWSPGEVIKGCDRYWARVLIPGITCCLPGLYQYDLISLASLVFINLIWYHFPLLSLSIWSVITLPLLSLTIWLSNSSSDITSDYHRQLLSKGKSNQQHLMWTTCSNEIFH